MRVLAIDVMPDGTLKPVMHDEIDFTKPPSNWPRPMRRAWQRRYNDYICQYGMAPDFAHYNAMKLTAQEWDKE